MTEQRGLAKVREEIYTEQYRIWKNKMSTFNRIFLS